jgi:four helix bundle protein
MAGFEDLSVWRKAHEVALGAYAVSKLLPEDEKFGLISQIRRAAVSVPANIVEGQERPGRADFCHFMDIALGSASELRYLLILVRDLGYVGDGDIAELVASLAGLTRMLRSFRAARR